MFREDDKRIYHVYGKKTIQIEKLSYIGDVKRLWQNILKQEVKHSEDQGPRRTEGHQPDGVEGIDS